MYTSVQYYFRPVRFLRVCFQKANVGYACHEPLGRKSSGILAVVDRWRVDCNHTVRVEINDYRSETLAAS
jgi:hypothetical protein